jgi:hypothetical protein
MCLRSVEIPTIKSGIGYKLVRKTSNPEVFLPEYPGFFLDGSGGIGFANLEMSDKPYIKANIIYKLNKTNRVYHKRMAGMLYDRSVTYRAGIHLFLEKPSEFHYGKGNMACLECRYSQAVACDENVVVALRVTPIKIG